MTFQAPSPTVVPTQPPYFIEWFSIECYTTKTKPINYQQLD